MHLPGDKSLSHRAVLFAAMAEGTTKLAGVLDSADVRATIGAVRELGAHVELDVQPDGSLAGIGARVGCTGAALLLHEHRLRQQRHDGAAAHGRARGMAGRGHAHRRRVALPTPHAPRHGAARAHGRALRGDGRGHAADHDPRHRRAQGDRLRLAGRVGPGQERGAARRPARSGPHDASPSPRPAETTPSGCFPSSACRSSATRSSHAAVDRGPDRPLRDPELRRAARPVIGGVHRRGGAARSGKRGPAARRLAQPDAHRLPARARAHGRVAPGRARSRRPRASARARSTPRTPRTSRRPP